MRRPSLYGSLYRAQALGGRVPIPSKPQDAAKSRGLALLLLAPKHVVGGVPETGVSYLVGHDAGEVVLLEAPLD